MNSTILYSLRENNIENTVKLYDKLKNNIFLSDSVNDLGQYLKDFFQIDFIELKLLDYSSLKKEHICVYSEKNETSVSNTQIIQINQNVTFYFSFQGEETLYTEELMGICNLISPILYFTYLKEIIEELKLTDSVTKLYNRTFLLQHLDKMLPLSRRENKKIAFLMIGIDHFKAVIDEFDYDIGDKVLQVLSQIIKDSIRTSDIAVRLEGDEFLVTLHNIAKEENALYVANKILDSFANSHILVNEETKQILKKTLCIGVCIYPDDAISIDQILKNADISLYEARNKGRSQVLLYNQIQDDNCVELF